MRSGRIRSFDLLYFYSFSFSQRGTRGQVQLAEWGALEETALAEVVDVTLFVRWRCELSR